MEVRGKGTFDLEAASKEYGFDPPSPADSEAPHRRDRSDETEFHEAQTSQFDLHSPTKESLIPSDNKRDSGWQYRTIEEVDRAGAYGARAGEKSYDDGEEETFDTGYRRSSGHQAGYAV